MALSPLLPWLLENSTYTTQTVCEHPTAQYVGSDLCFSSPSSNFLIAWPAIFGNHHMASKQMCERQNVQANALSRSISANTSDVWWIHWKRISKITHYKCTLCDCTLLQSTLSANKIHHGRKRKTLTYTFLLITACFCCYLKTSGLIKYPACSHLASKPSKKAELDTSPLKQTIENT